MTDARPLQPSHASTEPHRRPRFHTVPEAAELLRVDCATIYRAIRENAFPAVKIRGRYIVPAQVIDTLAHEAVESRHCVDVADYSLRRNTP